MNDIQRNLEKVRSAADTYQIRKDKIGVLGFSAGVSLSARASTLYEQLYYEATALKNRESSRPDFTVLIYPAFLDCGSNKSITEELVVTKKTPPMFLFYTADDTYSHSALVMVTALNKANIPFELHMLPNSCHGYGMRKGNRAAETWLPLFRNGWRKH